MAVLDRPGLDRLTPRRLSSRRLGSRRLSAPAAAIALGALAAGCSSAPEPQLGARPTEAMEQIERTKRAAGEGAELPEPKAQTPAEADEKPKREPVDLTEPIHFPSATPEGSPTEEPTLFEASEAERLRRRNSPPPSVVITDENLGDYAKGGRLTEMITVGNETSAGGQDTAAGSTPAPQDQETYWRTRVRDTRLAWRAAADRVDELRGKVAQLRFDFYAQDDPTYRDLEIKPAWDRTAVELTQARLRVADLETQVQLVLGEGLEAGALPGWLREGIDFEPESSADASGRPNEPGTAEVIEPPILEDPPK